MKNAEYVKLTSQYNVKALELEKNLQRKIAAGFYRDWFTLDLRITNKKRNYKLYLEAKEIVPYIHKQGLLEWETIRVNSRAPMLHDSLFNPIHNSINTVWNMHDHKDGPVSHEKMSKMITMWKLYWGQVKIKINTEPTSEIYKSYISQLEEQGEYANTRRTTVHENSDDRRCIENEVVERYRYIFKIEDLENDGTILDMRTKLNIAANVAWNGYIENIISAENRILDEFAELYVLDETMNIRFKSEATFLESQKTQSFENTARVIYNRPSNEIWENVLNVMKQCDANINCTVPEQKSVDSKTRSLSLERIKAEIIRRNIDFVVPLASKINIARKCAATDVNQQNVSQKRILCSAIDKHIKALLDAFIKEEERHTPTSINGLRLYIAWADAYHENEMLNKCKDAQDDIYRKNIEQWKTISTYSMLLEKTLVADYSHVIVDGVVIEALRETMRAEDAHVCERYMINHKAKLKQDILNKTFRETNIKQLADALLLYSTGIQSIEPRDNIFFHILKSKYANRYEISADDLIAPTKIIAQYISTQISDTIWIYAELHTTCNSKAHAVAAKECLRSITESIKASSAINANIENRNTIALSLPNILNNAPSTANIMAKVEDIVTVVIAENDNSYTVPSGRLGSIGDEQPMDSASILFDSDKLRLRYNSHWESIYNHKCQIIHQQIEFDRLLRRKELGFGIVGSMYKFSKNIAENIVRVKNDLAQAGHNIPKINTILKALMGLILFVGVVVTVYPSLSDIPQQSTTTHDSQRDMKIGKSYGNQIYRVREDVRNFAHQHAVLTEQCGLDDVVGRYDNPNKQCFLVECCSSLLQSMSIDCIDRADMYYNSLITATAANTNVVNANENLYPINVVTKWFQDISGAGIPKADGIVEAYKANRMILLEKHNGVQYPNSELQLLRLNVINKQPITTKDMLDIMIWDNYSGHVALVEETRTAQYFYNLFTYISILINSHSNDPRLVFMIDDLNNRNGYAVCSEDYNTLNPSEAKQLRLNSAQWAERYMHRDSVLARKQNFRPSGFAGLSTLIGYTIDNIDATLGFERLPNPKYNSLIPGMFVETLNNHCLPRKRFLALGNGTNNLERNTDLVSINNHFSRVDELRPLRIIPDSSDREILIRDEWFLAYTRLERWDAWEWILTNINDIDTWTIKNIIEYYNGKEMWMSKRMTQNEVDIFWFEVIHKVNKIKISSFSSWIIAPGMKNEYDRMRLRWFAGNNGIPPENVRESWKADYLGKLILKNFY